MLGWRKEELDRLGRLQMALAEQAKKKSYSYYI